MTPEKIVLITLEQTSPRFAHIFPSSVLSDLSQRARVVLNDSGRRFLPEEFAELAAQADAIITTWGTPYVDASAIAKAHRLRFVGHAAGSVRPVAAPEVWDAGITVTNAASAIATYVGEYALLATLAMLRSLPKHTPGAAAGSWDNIACDGQETLFGKTVGLIGLGHTARAFVRCLQPFRCRLIAHDPYVSGESAEKLGVSLVGFEELLADAKVISLHAAATEQTAKMLSADTLPLIQDGAALVNTARGALIDHDALFVEIKGGRFKAFLDVTEPEPLPQDHRLRSLPNVVITPHVAGPTPDGMADMSRCVIEDLKLFWAGASPRNVVTKDMLATMA